MRCDAKRKYKFEMRRVEGFGSVVICIRSILNYT